MSLEQLDRKPYDDVCAKGLRSLARLNALSDFNAAQKIRAVSTSTLLAADRDGDGQNSGVFHTATTKSCSTNHTPDRSIPATTSTRLFNCNASGPPIVEPKESNTFAFLPRLVDCSVIVLPSPDPVQENSCTIV